MQNIITICKALSEPSRLEALLSLDGGEMCLCDLAEKLGLAESTVSKHMSTLERAGLVQSRKDGRWRYFSHAEARIPGPPQHAVAWIRKCIKGSDAVTPQILEQSDRACTDRANVMFLCKGNSCRSQMAEGFLRKHANDLFHVYSAGLEPMEVDPMTGAVMKEVGIDISRQKAKSVLDFIGKMHFGYLITVCDRAEEVCPIFPGVSFRLYWPFEDPAAFQGTGDKRLDKFREVRDAIEKQILEWVQDYRAKTKGV